MTSLNPQVLMMNSVTGVQSLDAVNPGRQQCQSELGGMGYYMYLVTPTGSQL